MRTIDADALFINLDGMMDVSPTGYIHGDTVADMISDAPTVEAEPKWIPITERLPEEKGEYLVTIINNIGDYLTTIAYYSGVEGYEWDGKKVTAWAELPEPYRGEECPGE